MKTIILFFIATVCYCQENVTASVYNAVVEQCNSAPTHTAFMFELDLSNPYKHRIIAVSRDLLRKFPNKTKVLVSGAGKYDGVWTVRDKMNKRWVKRIDFLVNEEVKVGKWKNVIITKL